MATVDRYEPGQPAWVDLVTSDPETGRYTYCLANDLRAAGMVGLSVETMPPAWTTYLASDDVDAWTELLSEDLDAVTPLYTQVFTHRWRASEMPGWSRYATFSVGEQLAGGAVLTAPADSPFGRWARVRDPQGATFAILAPAG